MNIPKWIKPWSNCLAILWYIWSEIVWIIVSNLNGQSVAVGEETYIVPLGAIIESLYIKDEDVQLVAGKGEAFMLRDQYLPIIRTHKILRCLRPNTASCQNG